MATLAGSKAHTQSSVLVLQMHQLKPVSPPARHNSQPMFLAAFSVTLLAKQHLIFQTYPFR